jgi:hypothetical protein
VPTVNLPDAQRRLLYQYCLVFYLLLVYKWLNGLLLYQVAPLLFVNRPDVTTWFFMLTGFHCQLTVSATARLLADGLFYAAPLLVYGVFRKFPRLSAIAATGMLLINWLYVQCFTLFPINSIEGHIAWLLFPLAFLPRRAVTFELVRDGLRYFFLFFFASAGIWKLVQGGFFQEGQLSAILTAQHADILVLQPGSLYARFLTFFIDHTVLSNSLYRIATLLELVFITGFFTRRFDRQLALLFLVFLLFDHLFMRITYYEVIPFLLTFRLNTNKRKQPGHDSIRGQTLT